MKRLAVLTSGGDAPGMNAAIRAVVRTGIHHGWETYGIRHGYAGLLAGEFQPLGPRDVGGVLDRGGTFLGSARCPEFRSDEGRREAAKMLDRRNIDGLIVIGGNGSQTGAFELSQLGVPVVGVASTIDNDLYGSDITIGVDTALNVALEAIDRLKTTASSHRRAFLLEVMGRDCGYLALMTGITGGAEAVVVPEVPKSPEEVANDIRTAYERGKAHAIIVVAEGAKNDVDVLMAHFKKNADSLGFEVRAAIIGHVQRGGRPGHFDRFLATRLGAAATTALCEGKHGILMGHVSGEMVPCPLTEVVAKRKKLDPELFELARILAL